MFMSRQLEKTPKTKLRKQAEEVLTKKKQKAKDKANSPSRPSFDMWSDEDQGC